MRHMARPDGSCHFLTPDNLCGIYERRPLICNVARVYAEYFSDTMTEERFYEITEEACEKLRNEIVSKEEGQNEAGNACRH